MLAIRYARVSHSSALFTIYVVPGGFSTCVVYCAVFISVVLAILTNYLLYNFFYVLGNHSCSPNAEVTFPDNNFVLTVKALSHIKSREVRFEFCFF